MQIRIFPKDSGLLREMGQEYINTVNQLTEQAAVTGVFPRLTSKDVRSNLPSAIKNQVIRDARSIHRKFLSQGKRPILKRSVYYVNNQNYSINANTIAFPVMIDRKVQRLSVASRMTARELDMLKGSKIGLLRVVEISGKWYVQIAIETPMKLPAVGNETMGIDLGLKVPAVAVTSTGKTKFIGNGRQNKYIRRKYRERRRRLGKLKKLSAIRKQQNKEHRYIKDQNHKISRQIVNMAIAEQVSVIKIEKLTHIRQTTRTSRKNAKNLHNWSFYQLQLFISYKADLAGIRVAEVDPAYTSQKCPRCTKMNQAADRRYRCSHCRYQTHRDRVGAINILNQPVADGNNLPA